jgi:hypothetical protein
MDLLLYYVDWTRGTASIGLSGGGIVLVPKRVLKTAPNPKGTIMKTKKPIKIQLKTIIVSDPLKN